MARFFEAANLHFFIEKNTHVSKIILRHLSKNRFFLQKIAQGIAQFKRSHYLCQRY
jgi:hypothetical protein